MFKLKYRLTITPPHVTYVHVSADTTLCMKITLLLTLIKSINWFAIPHLELISVKHLMASVSQLSVTASISERNWSHCSRFAPNNPGKSTYLLLNKHHSTILSFALTHNECSVFHIYYGVVWKIGTDVSEKPATSIFMVVFQKFL
jgi:hypothetical protein